MHNSPYKIKHFRMHDVLCEFITTLYGIIDEENRDLQSKIKEIEETIDMVEEEYNIWV